MTGRHFYWYAKFKSIWIFHVFYSTPLHLPALSYCVLRMLGLNPGLLQCLPSQSDALTIRARSHPLYSTLKSYNTRSLVLSSLNAREGKEIVELFASILKPPWNGSIE